MKRFLNGLGLVLMLTGALSGIILLFAFIGTLIPSLGHAKQAPTFALLTGAAAGCCFLGSLLLKRNKAAGAPAAAPLPNRRASPPADPAKQADPPAPDDVTYIREIHSMMCGAWHQYDILLAAAPYGWATMIGWAAYMSADLKNIGTVSVSELGGEDLELIDAYRAQGCDLRRMEELREERGMLAIGGQSQALACPVKIVWINQTAVLRIFTLKDAAEEISPYAETVVRRTFGTPDAMKRARPIPPQKP